MEGKKIYFWATNSPSGIRDGYVKDGRLYQTHPYKAELLYVQGNENVFYGESMEDVLEAIRTKMNAETDRFIEQLREVSLDERKRRRHPRLDRFIEQLREVSLEERREE